MNNSKIALVFVISLTSASSAMSQETTLSDLWKQLDINASGFIEAKEANASSSVCQQWSKLDTDRDNKLSLDEFSLLDLTK